MTINTAKQWLTYVALEAHLTAEAYRVLLILLANIEYGNLAPICPKEIAVILQKDISNIKRGLRLLIARGIIKERYETGKLVGYEILANCSTQMDCDSFRPDKMPVE